MKILVVIIIYVISFVKINAQNNDFLSFNINEDKVVISGYDLVSYFNQNPKKGNKAIFVIYKGIIFQFINKSNKELFLKNSQKFIPKYGGWCAYAMGATGEKVTINPTTYKIINNKLYLFYNKFFSNTLKYWNKNEKDLIETADANWLKIISKEN